MDIFASGQLLPCSCGQHFTEVLAPKAKDDIAAQCHSCGATLTAKERKELNELYALVDTQLESSNIEVVIWEGDSFDRQEATAFTMLLPIFIGKAIQLHKQAHPDERFIVELVAQENAIDFAHEDGDSAFDFFSEQMSDPNAPLMLHTNLIIRHNPHATSPFNIALAVIAKAVDSLIEASQYIHNESGLLDLSLDAPIIHTPQETSETLAAQ